MGRKPREDPEVLRALALALPVVLVLLGACGGGGGGAPTRVAVSFTYDAPTAVDPNAALLAPACVAAVGPTHMHASWQAYAMVEMVANGPNQWTLTYADVPVGAQVYFRVNDPNLCPLSVGGAATAGVRANSVLLSNVVQTPGGFGPEAGLAFTVDGQGNVTP
jgi:hypothetical protein